MKLKVAGDGLSGNSPSDRKLSSMSAQHLPEQGRTDQKAQRSIPEDQLTAEEK